MTPLDYDPAYSAGVRNLLIETATPHTSKRRHRIWIGISVVAGLSVLGAGGAVAANYLLPGADIVTDTSSSHTITGVGPTDISIGSAPDGTNSLETSLACQSTGTLTWLDGSSMTCTSTDDQNDPGSASIPWSPTQTTFKLGATAGTHWRLTYTFNRHQPTSLATNAAGQTYGIDGSNGHPDLIAAIATNGRQGYINAKEEAAADPCRSPKNPAAAVKCTNDNRGKTFTIPVYESDGTTKVGVFAIGS
jgi:hypothetical protein